MVSVIIPVYNGSAFLEKTVNSVLNQKLVKEDLEIVIIDDCSSDESFKIASELAELDDRVTVHRHKINTGASKTFNEGIEKSKGEFVMILGQDDLLEENHINNMLSILKDDVNNAVVFCDYYQISENDEIFDKTRHCKHEDLVTRDLMFNNALPSCGAILRKKYVKEVQGYPEFEKFPNYGEWYLWILLSEKWRIKFCDTVRSFYRRHRSNMTNTFVNKDIQYKLEQYWYICRRLAIKSKNLTSMEKAKAFLYMEYKFIKSKVRWG